MNQVFNLLRIDTLSANDTKVLINVWKLMPLMRRSMIPYLSSKIYLLMMDDDPEQNVNRNDLLQEIMSVFDANTDQSKTLYNFCQLVDMNIFLLKEISEKQSKNSKKFLENEIFKIYEKKFFENCLMRIEKNLLFKYLLEKIEIILYQLTNEPFQHFLQLFLNQLDRLIGNSRLLNEFLIKLFGNYQSKLLVRHNSNFKKTFRKLNDVNDFKYFTEYFQKCYDEFFLSLLPLKSKRTEILSILSMRREYFENKSNRNSYLLMFVILNCMSLNDGNNQKKRFVIDFLNKFLQFSQWQLTALIQYLISLFIGRLLSVNERNYFLRIDDILFLINWITNQIDGKRKQEKLIFQYSLLFSLGSLRELKNSTRLELSGENYEIILDLIKTNLFHISSKKLIMSNFLLEILIELYSIFLLNEPNEMIVEKSIRLIKLLFYFHQIPIDFYVDFYLKLLMKKNDSSLIRSIIVDLFKQFNQMKSFDLFEYEKSIKSKSIPYQFSLMKRFYSTYHHLLPTKPSNKSQLPIDQFQDVLPTKFFSQNYFENKFDEKFLRYFHDWTTNTKRWKSETDFVLILQDEFEKLLSSKSTQIICEESMKKSCSTVSRTFNVVEENDCISVNFMEMNVNFEKFLFFFQFFAVKRTIYDSPIFTKIFGKFFVRMMVCESEQVQFFLMTHLSQLVEWNCFDLLREIFTEIAGFVSMELIDKQIENNLIINSFVPGNKTNLHDLDESQKIYKYFHLSSGYKWKLLTLIFRLEISKEEGRSNKFLLKLIKILFHIFTFIAHSLPHSNQLCLSSTITPQLPISSSSSSPSSLYSSLTDNFNHFLSLYHILLLSQMSKLRNELNDKTWIDQFEIHLRYLKAIQLMSSKLSVFHLQKLLPQLFYNFLSLMESFGIYFEAVKFSCQQEAFKLVRSLFLMSVNQYSIRHARIIMSTYSNFQLK
ncbi:hypothetical protein SNEBB_004995 [Seison nebaliae]|nr:hypothetical protein SNEBB_004995 [Seison nebaliae]